MVHTDEILLTADQFHNLMNHIPFSIQAFFMGSSPEQPQTVNRVLDQGAVQPELSRLLAVMSQVVKAVELILPVEQNTITYTVFFPKDGTSGQGMIEDDAGNFTLLEVDEMLKRLEEVFRISPSEDSNFPEFESSLSGNEALVLGGLMDLQRQETLQMARTNKTIRPTGERIVNPMSRVLQMVEQISELSAQGPEIVPVWQTLFLLSQLMPLSFQKSQDVPVSIQNLEKEGWVESENGGLQLNSNLASFANQSLVATGMGFLTVRNLEEDGINEQTIPCLLSNCGTLCGWIENEQVRLKGGNNLLLFRIYEKELRKPLLSPDSAKKAESLPLSLKCPACGQVLNPGATFCPKCGTAVTSLSARTVPGKAVFCPNCGTAINSDAQFCRKCGKKL
jgi:hypothetical protein